MSDLYYCCPNCDSGLKVNGSEELVVCPECERLGLPSASGFERVMLCPGSVALEAQCPPEPESEEAASGTRIHEALETGDDAELVETEADIAKRLSGLEKEALAYFISAYGCHGETPNVIREHRCWIKNRKSGDKIASSKPDVIYVFGDCAFCANFKTGWKDQTSANINIQGRIEALSVWHEFPNVKRIRWGYLQHRLKTSVDFVDYTLEDLEHSERDMLFSIWRTKQPDAPRVPSTSCRYCKAKAYCDVAASWALSVSHQSSPAGVSLENVPLYVTALPLPNLSYIENRRTVIEAILKAVTHRLKQLPAAELETLGFKLKDGAKRHDITDEVKATELLIDHGFTEDEISQCRKTARGKVAEVLAAKRGMTKKAANEETLRILAPVIESGQNSPSLVAI